MAPPHGDSSAPTAPLAAIRTAVSREDKRRPKALTPYVILFGTCVVCVIFALVCLLNQG